MLAGETDLKRALAHVLWIGGPPDAGKTSIAQLLARKYKLQVYRFDRREMDHIARADPARQPALAAFGARLRDRLVGPGLVLAPHWDPRCLRQPIGPLDQPLFTSVSGATTRTAPALRLRRAVPVGHQVRVR